MAAHTRNTMKIDDMEEPLKVCEPSTDGDRAEALKISTTVYAGINTDYDINLDSDTESNGIELDPSQEDKILNDTVDSIQELALEKPPPELEPDAEKTKTNDGETLDEKPPHKRIFFDSPRRVPEPTAGKVEKKSTETTAKSYGRVIKNSAKVDRGVMKYQALPLWQVLQMSVEERKAYRLKRFGPATVYSARADILLLSETLEKMKKRAERFDEAYKNITKLELKLKIVKRKASFSIP